MNALDWLGFKSLKHSFVSHLLEEVQYSNRAFMYNIC